MTAECNNHLNELYGDGWLANPSPPDHHDFVLVLVHPPLLDDHLHDHQQLNGPPSAASAAWQQLSGEGQSGRNCLGMGRAAAAAAATWAGQQQQQQPKSGSSATYNWLTHTCLLLMLPNTLWQQHLGKFQSGNIVMERGGAGDTVIATQLPFPHVMH